MATLCNNAATRNDATTTEGVRTMDSAGIGFTVEELGNGDLIATTTDPRLAGIVWEWTPGGAYVEYGLGLGNPVGVCGVWDYEAGVCELAPSADALAGFLSEYYADGDSVAAARDEVAQGGW